MKLFSILYMIRKGCVFFLQPIVILEDRVLSYWEKKVVPLISSNDDFSE